MSNRFDDTARKAADKTDKKLAQDLAKLNHLSPDKVKELLPDPGDWATYAELMRKVNQATNRNQKFADLTKNMAKFAGVATKLLDRIP